MRDRLSDLLVRTCTDDPHVLVLSGDHGYALFDALRSRHPRHFLNVGVMEQGMIGIAAGLAKTGFRPIVYGLSSFVPMRVLEQIKMDLCHARLPVVLLGDGAGLVYSTLGASHQCGEDVAVLRTLPGMTIFTPADEYELEACFEEALQCDGPSYVRIGKSDRPRVDAQRPRSTAPRHLLGAPPGAPTIIAMGSMSALGHELAREFGLGFVSVLRVKPLHRDLIEIAARAAGDGQPVIVLEEHARSGGLASAIGDALIDAGRPVPRMRVCSLKDKFVESCGTYQHALSEHELSDAQIRGTVAELAANCQPGMKGNRGRGS